MPTTQSDTSNMLSSEFKNMISNVQYGVPRSAITGNYQASIAQWSDQNGAIALTMGVATAAASLLFGDKLVEDGMQERQESKSSTTRKPKMFAQKSRGGKKNYQSKQNM